MVRCFPVCIFAGGLRISYPLNDESDDYEYWGILGFSRGDGSDDTFGCTDAGVTAGSGDC